MLTFALLGTKRAGSGQVDMRICSGYWHALPPPVRCEPAVVISVAGSRLRSLPTDQLCLLAMVSPRVREGVLPAA